MCKQRSASSSVHDLVKFTDNKFYELADETKTHKEHIKKKSISMCKFT